MNATLPQNDLSDHAPLPPVRDSAGDRPLALRRRPDLVIVPQEYGRHRYWLVKDPVSLQYYHLRDEEYAILEMLDGRTGLAAIKARFEKRFAPYRLPVETIHAFLGRLHECGLLLSDAPGQGEQLLKRADIARKRRRLAAGANILAIRFRGIDPQPLLIWLAARCGWLFSPACLVVTLMLVLAATAVVVVHAPGLSAMQAEIQEFVTPGNLVWLAITLAAAKVLHELGHALTCIRLGGQCRELGLMLLVFTPCLYCDVSDAWTFKNKWRRIAVSAAGIIVEIVLASLAALVWCFSPPGLVHALSFNVMVVCSVSTVLFNGNPLMRYDGYYVLADFVEVPNLAEQSRAVLARVAGLLFLGIRQNDDSVRPERGRFLLGLYGLASLAYRCFAVCAVLWIAHRVSAAWGVAVLGDAVAVIALAGMLLPPIWFSATFLNNQRLTRRASWLRMLAFGGFWIAALTVVALVPWPCRVTSPLVIEPENARPVYAVVAGAMTSSARPGERVDMGQEVARLVNLDVHREVVELMGKRDQQRRQLAVLRARQALDSEAAALIPTAEAALVDLDERLRQRQLDERSLVLRAPIAGTVLPPSNTPAPAHTPGQLSAWNGSPLDEQNRGCQIEPGTLVCMIASRSGDITDLPERPEGCFAQISDVPVSAVVMVDQDSVALIREGQLVHVRIDSLPGEVYEGRVAEIASRDAKVVPRELASGGELPLQVDRQAESNWRTARPASITYQVRVRLWRQPEFVVPGSRGEAKFFVEPQSLFARIERAIRQNVTLRW
jgi:putative peptide zinc metalloprotease protein